MKQLLLLGSRFGVVSATCALLNIVILIAGDSAGLDYVTATATSFAACVLVGYLLHCRFTFREQPGLAGLARYSAAMALNFPLLLVSIWLLHQRAGLAMPWAAPLSTLIGFSYNFVASRWAIHRRLAGHS